MHQHNEATAEQIHASARDQRQQQAEAKASPGAARPGYKRTKLGWLPEGWKLTPVGDITTFHKQGYYTTDNYSADGEYILLRGTDMHNPMIDHSSSPRINMGRELFEAFKVEVGDFLVVRSGTIGGYGIVSKELRAVFASYLIKFQFDPSQVLTEYFGTFFASDLTRKQLDWVTQGSSNVNINAENIKALQIPLPPLPEQQRIADLLGTWDAAITKLEQLIAAKQRRKQGLMQELLSGKRRFPGFTEKWKEVRLGKLFTERIETGLVDLPLLSVGAAGVYPQSDDDRRDNSNPDKAKYKRICPGDIGYNTMRMWQGRCALSALEGIVSPAYTILTPTDKIDVVFGSQLFKWSNTIHLFYRNSQGMASDTWNLKYKEFAPIKVTIPGLEEQRLIGEVLNAHDVSIEQDTQLVTHLTIQKRGLMQQLLTGAVRTKNN